MPVQLVSDERRRSTPPGLTRSSTPATSTGIRPLHLILYRGPCRGEACGVHRPDVDQETLGHAAYQTTANLHTSVLKRRPAWPPKEPPARSAHTQPLTEAHKLAKKQVKQGALGKAQNIPNPGYYGSRTSTCCPPAGTDLPSGPQHLRCDAGYPAPVRARSPRSQPPTDDPPRPLRTSRGLGQV